MRTFKDILRWYNSKGVVVMLEATEKMVDFHHNRRNDMLKLGCTSPSLGKICLHRLITSNFYPFTESDKVLLEKYCKDVIGGPSIVFTKKTVVGKTSIRDSTNQWKAIVVIDASQLYILSRCQSMPTGLYTRWQLDSESCKYKPCQNETKSLEHTAMSYFQRARLQCKLESFFTTGTQKIIDT